MDKKAACWRPPAHLVAEAADRQQGTYFAMCRGMTGAPEGFYLGRNLRVRLLQWIRVPSAIVGGVGHGLAAAPDVGNGGVDFGSVAGGASSV